MRQDDQIVSESSDSTSERLCDIAHLASGKAIALGTIYVVLALSAVTVTVYLYIYLPVMSPKLKNEPWQFLLLAPLFVVYIFSIKAAYWFLTSRRHDFFVRISPNGLYARFPEERDWFCPGYKTVEMMIPWTEVNDCFAVLHLHYLIPSDSCVVIATTPDRIASISSCHFAEGRRELVNYIVQAARRFRTAR